MQRFETSIFFRCPKCTAANKIEIEVPEFDFQSDRMSEQMSEGQISFECPSCEWEFDAYAFCSSGGCEIALVEDSRVKFAGDPPMYAPPEDDDSWLDYDPPDDPFSIFTETHRQMQGLLDQEIRFVDDPQLMPRMALSQLISAMEAYLSDTLIRKVVGHTESTRKLLLHDKHINQDRFSLRDLVAQPTLVDDSVRKYLRTILYHNLERVRFLYKSALDVDIKYSEANWEPLLIAVNRRHDCVHRNGFDTDGNRLTLFTKDYVRNVAGIIQGLISHIEAHVSADGWDEVLPFG